MPIRMVFFSLYLMDLYLLNRKIGSLPYTITIRVDKWSIGVAKQLFNSEFGDISAFYCSLSSNPFPR